VDFPDNGTKAGTAGGTLLAKLMNIQDGDIVKTAVLSVIGAGVSFGVSRLLQFIIDSVKRRRK